MNPEIQLAPGAGAGIGRELANLLIASPDFLPCLRDAFLDGLKAMSWFYDKHAKEWHSEPDARTRVNTAALILSNLEGEPVKRVVMQHIGGASGSPTEDLEAALERSPALAEAVRRTLAKAERNAAIKRAKPVELD